MFGFLGRVIVSDFINLEIHLVYHSLPSLKHRFSPSLSSIHIHGEHGCYMCLTSFLLYNILCLFSLLNMVVTCVSHLTISETTILDVVQATVGAETEVTYEKYPSIYTIERHEFSFAIVAVGEAPYAETWGDNSELTIPVNGADIISLVADQIPTLVILISGRRLVLEPRLLEKIDALVAAWLPGNEGEGIIDVIFCSHDFKDKLPVTWFRRVERQISQIGVVSKHIPEGAIFRRNLHA